MFSTVAHWYNNLCMKSDCNLILFCVICNQKSYNIVCEGTVIFCGKILVFINVKWVLQHI